MGLTDRFSVRLQNKILVSAGAIHSDLERGFIRAEVFKYSDLVQYGSEQKCKESGKMSVKGKNYIIEDGDIINIRFNV